MDPVVDKSLKLNQALRQAELVLIEKASNRILKNADQELNQFPLFYRRLLAQQVAQQLLMRVQRLENLARHSPAPIELIDV